MQMILDQKSMLDTQLLSEHCLSSIKAIQGVFKSQIATHFRSILSSVHPASCDVSMKPSMIKQCCPRWLSNHFLLGQSKLVQQRWVEIMRFENYTTNCFYFFLSRWACELAATTHAMPELYSTGHFKHILASFAQSLMVLLLFKSQI